MPIFQLPRTALFHVSPCYGYRDQLIFHSTRQSLFSYNFYRIITVGSGHSLHVCRAHCYSVHLPSVSSTSLPFCQKRDEVCFSNVQLQDEVVFCFCF